MVAMAVVIGLLAASCGGSGREWGSEAEDWTTMLLLRQGEEGGIAFDRVWAPDATWDFRSVVSGSQVLERDQALAVVDLILPPGSDAWVSDSAPFVSADGVVLPNRFDWAPSGTNDAPDTELPAHLVMVMDPISVLGAHETVSAMAAASVRERRADTNDADVAEDLMESWVAAWSAPDPTAFRLLYARDAVVEDSIAGWEARGAADIAARATGQTRTSWAVAILEDGTPAVYPIAHRPDGLVGIVALVEAADRRGCPGRLAIVVEIRGQFLVREERYWEVERARTCVPRSALPEDTWWRGRSLLLPVPTPAERLEELTSAITASGTSIDVRNSTAGLDRLLEWGLSRFEQAGLDHPRLTKVVFSSHVAECDSVAGRAHAGDDGWDLLICTSEEEACEDTSCTTFELRARHTILHELAHVWMDDHLDDDAQEAFLEFVGLDDWLGTDRRWVERGIEHAAEMIAWGLLDSNMYVLRLGGPSTDHLTEGFELLTGVEPLQPAAHPVEPGHRTP